MKKAVILLIGLIFVGAVVIISLFAGSAMVDNETIYAEKIEFLENRDENSFYIFAPNKTEKTANVNSNGGTLVLQLKWKITPDNTTVKEVSFSISCDESVEKNITSGGKLTLSNISPKILLLSLLRLKTVEI